MSRDTQRSLVYRWERAVTRSGHYAQTIDSVDDVAAYLKPIWRAERGRYGHAGKPMPEIHPGGWGQVRAHAKPWLHRISLPRWSRNPWVILHEAAHILAGSGTGGWHGPRFVGCMIGLAARHLERDAEALMAKADEMGVRYDRRSIGAVPAYPLWRKVEPLMPCTYIEAAVELGLTYREVLGAALHLIRVGQARWRGKTLVRIQPMEAA